MRQLLLWAGARWIKLDLTILKIWGYWSKHLNIFERVVFLCAFLIRLLSGVTVTYGGEGSSKAVRGVIRGHRCQSGSMRRTTHTHTVAEYLSNYRYFSHQLSVHLYAFFFLCVYVCACVRTCSGLLVCSSRQRRDEQLSIENREVIV